MDWTTKDLRKAAFAVGFGVTLGKSVGDLASATLNGVWLALMERFAKKSGSKKLQEIVTGVEIEG